VRAVTSWANVSWLSDGCWLEIVRVRVGVTLLLDQVRLLHFATSARYSNASRGEQSNLSVWSAILVKQSLISGPVAGENRFHERTTERLQVQRQFDTKSDEGGSYHLLTSEILLVHDCSHDPSTGCSTRYRQHGWQSDRNTAIKVLAYIHDCTTNVYRDSRPRWSESWGSGLPMQWEGLPDLGIATDERGLSAANGSLSLCCHAEVEWLEDLAATLPIEAKWGVGLSD